jgi:hypothetical protein
LVRVVAANGIQLIVVGQATNKTMSPKTPYLYPPHFCKYQHEKPGLLLAFILCVLTINFAFSQKDNPLKYKSKFQYNAIPSDRIKDEHYRPALLRFCWATNKNKSPFMLLSFFNTFTKQVNHLFKGNSHVYETSDKS